MSTPVQGNPQTNTAPQQPPQAPPMVVQTPYVPTEEEQAYMAECAKAILAGADAATAAAAASNSEQYLRYAQGVKTLTDAYSEIKNGGNISRHQGS